MFYQNDTVEGKTFIEFSGVKARSTAHNTH